MNRFSLVPKLPFGNARPRNSVPLPRSIELQWREPPSDAPTSKRSLRNGRSQTGVWERGQRMGNHFQDFPFFHDFSRTSYMASFVNTRTVSREGFFLRLRRYYRNVLTFASGLRRYFLQSGCGRRPHQPAMEGRSRPALRRGRLAAGRCAQRPRNSRVPSVGPSKRWAPARASGPSE